MSPPDDEPAVSEPEYVQPVDSLPVTQDQEEDDEQQIERIAELLPPEDRRELLAVIEKSSSHSGWLPQPSDMAEYEAILPGLAERIVRMPEREQAHRHKFMEDAGRREFSIRRWGQVLAIVSLVLVLGFSGFLAYDGNPELGAKVAILTVVGLVGIFVTGRYLDFRTATAEKKDED